MNPLLLIFPRSCPFCRQPIAHRETECEPCRKIIMKQSYQRTLKENIPCYAPMLYSGLAKEAIHAFKFRKKYANADSFASLMHCQAEREGIRADIITCVPMHPAVKRQRGFNQAELLARKLAKLMHLPYCDLLKKIKNNQTQHLLTAKERIINVQNVFQSIHTDMICGKHVLLVDDVCTTGSTLSECCRILQNSGAASVCCITAALVREEIYTGDLTET